MSEFTFHHYVKMPDGQGIELECVICIYEYGYKDQDGEVVKNPQLYIKEAVDPSGYFVETKIPIDLMEEILKTAEDYYWDMVNDGLEYAYG
jgi:hypothetical protein